MALWAFWMVVVSAASVLIALAAVWLVYLTLRETRRTAKAQLRAYFLVDDVTVVEVPAGRNVVVLFRNSGQTPAQSVVGFVGFVHGEGDEQRFDVDDARFRAARDVGPGQDLNITKPLAEANLPYRELENVEAGGAPFFVHGLMRYVDVFEASHHTKFRWYYNARGKTFYVADKGNEAD
jgi:hypothetical protein